MTSRIVLIAAIVNFAFWLPHWRFAHVPVNKLIVENSKHLNKTDESILGAIQQNSDKIKTNKALMLELIRKSFPDLECLKDGYPSVAKTSNRR